ncbi:hypothetical protein ADK70_22120 [Streptomyces rimosus subsp. pseudoverticillatus]|uniref:hypothetical protein n=1 Tax=Streptomyces rimosus TaxID=1927 RepID=UPI0006B261BE|nr:hypothetical protein [Streptomyces rimosus]KOT84821.1 hypothetical protein ADK70_22120 [Streptomyces rimosus subsp. pseudoverticillatus]
MRLRRGSGEGRRAARDRHLAGDGKRYGGCRPTASLHPYRSYGELRAEGTGGLRFPAPGCWHIRLTRTTGSAAIPVTAVP